MQGKDEHEQAKKKCSSHYLAASRVKIGAREYKEFAEGVADEPETRALLDITAEVPISIGPETIREERRDEDL